MRRYAIVLTVGLIALGIGSSRNLYMYATEQLVCEKESVRKVTNMGMNLFLNSPQRNILVNELNGGMAENVTEEDIANLERLVEAEAGGEDYEGKLLVANVVLNRVQNKDFPNTVTEVIFQKNEKTTQFSPVGSGKIYRVTAGTETKEAVQNALKGEDVSDGALYFAARKIASNKKMKWFDDNLTFLFRHGGHDFFR